MKAAVIFMGLLAALASIWVTAFAISRAPVWMYVPLFFSGGLGIFLSLALTLCLSNKCK